MFQDDYQNETLLSAQQKKIDLPRWSTLTVYILISMILSVSGYSIVAPFMPVELVKKGVDEGVMGMIMGIYSIGLIVGSPIMSTIIRKLGRRLPIIIGCLSLAIAYIAFALIAFIENKNLYVMVCFVLRLMMGFGTTAMQVTFLSIVSNFYPSNKAWLIGILEACAGAGMMLGPLFGMGLFAIGGYNFMLVFVGIVFLVLAVMIPFLFPKYLDDFTEMARDVTLHN